MTREQKALLELVNIGAGGECLFSADVLDADWNEVFELAQEQGVVGVAWHGLEILYKNGVDECPADVKLQWYGANKQRAIAVSDKKKLCVEFVDKLGIPCVVLKGLDYCRFWPEESWREFGDLDIWALPKEDSRLASPTLLPLGNSSELDCSRLNAEFKIQDSGSSASDKIQDSGEHKSNYDIVNQRIEEIGGKRVDNGYYKHSEWMYKDLMVENHQFLTCFDGTKKGKALEKTLQELLVQDGSKLFNNVQGCDGMLSPCNEFTALFMLLHAHQHFFFEGLSLRQILDWKFFIEREENNTNWADVLNVLENADIKGFYDVMTEFCVKYLGLRTSLSYASDNDVLQQFTDVIFAGEDVGSKMKRLVCRFRRMWRFREFLGESLLTRIKNTLVFNRLHKVPEL